MNGPSQSPRHSPPHGPAVGVEDGPGSEGRVRSTGVPPRRRRGLRVFARTSLALGAALLLTALAAHAAGVRFNYTTSIPRGLYLASDFDPADVRLGQLVEACPSREGAEAVAAYLPDGPCPGGVIRLGKEVVGLPGDRVTVDSAGVAVNGVRLPRSTPLFRDRTGRPLYPWLGEYALGPGEYWLHSSRVETSIDSRYVGPVSDVRAELRPLLVED